MTKQLKCNKSSIDQSEMSSVVLRMGQEYDVVLRGEGRIRLLETLVILLLDLIEPRVTGIGQLISTDSHISASNIRFIRSLDLLRTHWILRTEETEIIKNMISNKQIRTELLETPFYKFKIMNQEYMNTLHELGEIETLNDYMTISLESTIQHLDIEIDELISFVNKTVTSKLHVSIKLEVIEFIKQIWENVE